MVKKKTKFIIFGQSRSGSTLLLELLNSHPDIHCEGELFNKFKLYIKSRFLLKIFRRFPQIYANYRQKKSHATVYGFKLFFFQVYFPEKFLRKLYRKGWKFIHVRRENIFNQSFSNIIAIETNYWHRYEGEEATHSTLKIPPERLLKVLKNRMRWKKKELSMMSVFDRHTVIYESDLLNEEKWQDTLIKVFKYLGVSPVAVETKLKTTDSRSLSDRVENYNELMVTLKNSEYAYLIPPKDGKEN